MAWIVSSSRSFTLSNHSEARHIFSGHAAVSVVGVPHFRVIPAPAVAAFYHSGEKARAALQVFHRTPGFHKCLRLLKHGGRYNGLMVMFHIILRHFVFIDFFLLREEVHRVDFLQERIPLIFLVGEDAPNRAFGPFCLAARCGASFFRQHSCNRIKRTPLQEHPVNPPDNLCMLLIHSKPSILAPLVTVEPSKGDHNFSICKPFPMPQVTLSEMNRLSSCTREDIMTSSSSSLLSNVQMFSFSKPLSSDS